MSLSEALSSQNWEQVITQCEEDEQMSAANGTTYEHGAEHMLALLLQGDVLEAMHVWQRLDQNASSKANNVWNLTQAIHTGDRQSFFNCALSSKWPTQVEQAMVSKLVDLHRQRTIMLISRAYSTVSVSTVARLLGLSNTEVADLARANEWTVDNDNFVNIPPKCRASADQVKPLLSKTIRQAADDKYSELQRLTEQVVRLQTT